jgi:hypothetical protein
VLAAISPSSSPFAFGFYGVVAPFSIACFALFKSPFFDALKDLALLVS